LLEALAFDQGPRGQGGKGPRDEKSLSLGPLLEKLHEIVDLSGEAEVFVAYVVADIVRKLYLGMQMKRQGMNDFAIGKELKIWPMERQQLFTAALKRFNPAAATRLFDRIVDLDTRSKSGRGDALRNLECFCAALGDEVK
jgi:DNA polymerase III delta subunit